MNIHAAIKIVQKHFDIKIEINPNFNNCAFIISKSYKFIELGNKSEVVTGLLHELGHYLHCHDFNIVNKKLAEYKNRKAFRFIAELQAWKRCFALSHMLNIPIDTNIAKHYINNYYVTLPKRLQKKFRRFVKTI